MVTCIPRKDLRDLPLPPREVLSESMSQIPIALGDVLLDLKSLTDSAS